MRRPGVVRGRIVSVALVGTLVVVGLAGAEAWPFSSFALFSTVRTGEIWSRRLAAVDPEGAEHAVDFWSDPVAARSARHELPELGALDAARRRSAVRTWLELGGLDPGRFVAVRVYRVRLALPTEEDAHAEELARQLVVEVPL